MNRFISALLLVLLSLASSIQAGTLTFDTYYHNDHLGSPVAATDERSDLLWRAHFRTYGERQENPADAAFGNVGYTGHMQDADNSLVYMQARYYDPLIGRFLAVDPVGVRTSNPMSFNRYLYGSNNPQKYVDPDGRIIETAWDIANIAMGAGSTAANIAAGNYGKAAIDAVGVVVDVAAMVIPGVPGGAGAGIKALRGADEAGSVAKGTDFYRGAKPGDAPDLTPRPNDFKVDGATGTVKPTHGVSIFDNPSSVSSKGFVPHKIDQSTIPDSLQIIQRGKDSAHFEITPKPGANLTPQQFFDACSSIKCSN